MTNKEYRKKSGEWFRGKEAKTNRDIQNLGGELIPSGDTVVITGKNGRGGFNIRSKTNGVSITRVNYLSIDLDFETL